MTRALEKSNTPV